MPAENTNEIKFSEVAVSDEMISAGVEAYYFWFEVAPPMALVEKIYQAMASCSESLEHPDRSCATQLMPPAGQSEYQGELQGWALFSVLLSLRSAETLGPGDVEPQWYGLYEIGEIA